MILSNRSKSLERKNHESNRKNLDHISTAEEINKLQNKIDEKTTEMVLRRLIALQIMNYKEYDPQTLNVSEGEDAKNLYIKETATQTRAEKTITHLLDFDGLPTGQFMESPERYIIPIKEFSTRRY